MSQNFTSAATSINSRKLPAVYRKMSFLPGEIVVDYGCGRFTDHITKHLQGVEYLPYDKFNQPESVNIHTAGRLAEISLSRNRCPFTFICSNVLNVIDDDETIQEILGTFAAFIAGPGPQVRAVITVYEGDRSGVGRQTGKDSWQRNQKLAEYLAYMPENVDAHITNGMIIMERGF